MPQRNSRVRNFAVIVVALSLPALGDAVQAATYSLIPSHSIQDSRAEQTAELVVFNTGDSVEEVELPAELRGTLRGDLRSWPVTLQSAELATRVSLQPGQFSKRSYRFSLPEPVSGQFVLDIEHPPARAALEVRDFFSVSRDERDRTTPPPATRIERSFASRFLFHDPVFFIYGMEAPSAKFQFSFKYRLLGPESAFGAAAPSPRGFYLAFTQRSLWDIDAESSPFYDTSYMPEVFYEWLAPDFGRSTGWFHLLGLQSGVQHESNGRDDEASRNVNIGYARSGVALGNLAGWRLILMPRAFTYLSKSNDNYDIAEYRGHYDLLMQFGRNDGTQFSLTGRVGNGWRRGSVQVDVTQPVRMPWIGLRTYLQLQYFNGYGESIRLYNQKTSVWRLGLAFVR